MIKEDGFLLLVFEKKEIFKQEDPRNMMQNKVSLCTGITNSGFQNELSYLKLYLAFTIETKHCSSQSLWILMTQKLKVLKQCVA